MTQINNSTSDNGQSNRAGRRYIGLRQLGIAVVVSCFAILSNYLNAHWEHWSFPVLLVIAFCAYIFVIIWLAVRLVRSFLGRSIDHPAIAVASVLMLLSLPLWSAKLYDAIDILRFYLHRDYYLSKVNAVAPDQFGNKRVVFDWGISGSFLSTRLNELVFVEGTATPILSAPNQCSATQLHISGGFYSVRSVC